MRLFKRFLRISIFPNYQEVYDTYKNSYKDLTKEKVEKLYPPIVINRYPDEFSCSCSIIMEAMKATELILDIVNLSPVIRFSILNNRYNKMSVEAGYLGENWKLGDECESQALSILFKGTILWMGTEVKARQSITTRFVALAGKAEGFDSYGGLMELSYKAGYNLYQLIREVSLNSNNPDIRLNLSEENRNKILNTSSTIKDAKDLLGILNHYSIEVAYDWEGTSAYTIEDYIKADANNQIMGKIWEINETTGLISMPSLQNDRKVKFTHLLDTRLKLLDFVKINNHDVKLPLLSSTDKADLEKAYSGTYLDDEGIYRIQKISYSLDTRGDNWTMEMEVIARNIYNTLTTGSK